MQTPVSSGRRFFYFAIWPAGRRAIHAESERARERQGVKFPAKNPEFSPQLKLPEQNFLKFSEKIKKMCFFAAFLLAFQAMCVILYNITQTYGVTVAQVILVHFVEVRILVGLPFFLQ